MPANVMAVFLAEVALVPVITVLVVVRLYRRRRALPTSMRPADD